VNRKLPYETTIQLIACLAGLPAVLVSLVLLWSTPFTPKVQWTLSILVLLVWVSCVAALRKRVTYPMQTLTNLLAALREGDYSLRSRGARRDDALGEVMQEINALGETLLVGRREAAEATALLRSVMTEIDVAVFTFDERGVLRFINRAGIELLGQPAKSLLGRPANEIGLIRCLEGDSSQTLTHQFPGQTERRWGLRRTEFRENGRPRQLLVLSDLSQPLRDEERAAWQRLIRVLGHELNNSLAPIHSIAGSLDSLIRKAPAERTSDWQEDVQSGLAVISSRAEALSRFMASYARLARLPEPTLLPHALATLVHRAVALETRLHAVVSSSEDFTLSVDADQIEQVLINLIRNAADAALETNGRVEISWMRKNREIELRIDDTGPGLTDTANLFVPFFTTKPEGSGIGLVLSRQIVEAHRGALRLENRPLPEHGCRATLRLPQSQNETPQSRNRTETDLDRPHQKS
jgi:two-component system, NtrC family, nitrogen regulation sensor histidine kinase NtrY